MTAIKLQRLLFWFAWAITAVLLGRFAVDFVRQMPAVLGGAFVLLVGATLGVAAMNIRNARNREQILEESGFSPKLTRALLLASVPLGFFASSLDCTGLSFSGCTPYCTFIKTVWIPVAAIACAVYAVRPRQPLLTGILLLSFMPLAPHCLCFNPGNGWWIERLGASPTCYAWGFASSLLALGALWASKRQWQTLIVSGSIIGGATAFFIGHHYFHRPW